MLSKINLGAYILPNCSLEAGYTGKSDNLIFLRQIFSLFKSYNCIAEQIGRKFKRMTTAFSD